MSHRPDLIVSDINAYLKSLEEKGMLRFVTCGSVDDGKSTLIGRLLWDSKLIYEDQMAALEADSKHIGTQNGAVDFALLLDGLQAEREQGITIDVAYRFFSTDKRKFIVADTPGHEQYTRNMITGASTAHVAVILIDARKGVLTQTRRHSFLVSLVGIRHVVLAINKMDLVDFDASRFYAIREEYAAFSAGLGLHDISAIPISALQGDNVLRHSGHTPWYNGPTLMEYLETINVVDETVAQPFRMPVQWINRPDPDFRGFCGTIASGQVKPGDSLMVAASGTMSRVARIVTMDGDLDGAQAGQSVTLTLEDEIDISRGDVLADPRARPEQADQFETHIVWMHEERLLPGRRYLLKCGASTVIAQISSLKYKINVNTLKHEPAKTLELNEVGVCNLALGKAIAADPYRLNRTTGGFILMDRFTNVTVGAGMIDFPLRRATNIHWQAQQITRELRSELMGQHPCVIWLTGLSGSGKSTIADALELKLAALGKHTMLLDGDNVRHGLNKDLGFTDADRVENIRRIGEVAKLMTDAGLIVITAFISPYRAERDMVRHLLPMGDFIEIYLNTSLEECERRDVKGLYKKARQGQLPNFTGISAPYEPPASAELMLDTASTEVEDAVESILRLLNVPA
jgi:bifunctional enzyme CysN/CysC